MKSDTVPVVKVPRVLANDGWSELSKIYEIYKDPYKYKLKDWVGINHYHRYFAFEDINGVVPDISEKMADTFMLISQPIITEGMRKQYEICHNVADFDLCMEIAKKWYPDYAELIDLAVDSDTLIVSNVVLMRREDFLNMFEFVFNILLAWCKEVGINPESNEDFHKRVTDNIVAYNKVHKEDDATYSEQARIPAFLSERLMTIWIFKNAQNKKLLFAEISEK